MAKYVSFTFQDDCGLPVIVRFEEDLTKKQIDEIEKKVSSVIEERLESEDYWDCDGAIINNILDDFGYKYEFVDIERNIEVD